MSEIPNTVLNGITGITGIYRFFTGTKGIGIVYTVGNPTCVHLGFSVYLHVYLCVSQDIDRIQGGGLGAVAPPPGTHLKKKHFYHIWAYDY